jgi:hypothetical protein
MRISSTLRGNVLENRMDMLQKAGNDIVYDNIGMSGESMAETLDYIGVVNTEGITGLYAEYFDGEIGEVWITEASAPWELLSCYRLIFNGFYFFKISERRLPEYFKKDNGRE